MSKNQAAIDPVQIPSNVLNIHTDYGKYQHYIGTVYEAVIDQDSPPQHVIYNGRAFEIWQQDNTAIRYLAADRSSIELFRALNRSTGYTIEVPDGVTPFDLKDHLGFYADASELGIKAGAKYPSKIKYQNRIFCLDGFRTSDNAAIYLSADNKKFEVLND